jgi:hypothetical protein
MQNQDNTVGTPNHPTQPATTAQDIYNSTLANTLNYSQNLKNASNLTPEFVQTQSEIVVSSLNDQKQPLNEGENSETIDATNYETPQ